MFHPPPTVIHLRQYHLISTFFCSARVTVAVRSLVRGKDGKLILILATFESFISDVRVQHARYVYSFSQFLVCIANHSCMLLMHAVCLGVQRLHKFWKILLVFPDLPVYPSSVALTILDPRTSVACHCSSCSLDCRKAFLVFELRHLTHWWTWIESSFLNSGWCVALFRFDRTYSSTVLNDRCVEQIYTYWRAAGQRGLNMFNSKSFDNFG